LINATKTLLQNFVHKLCRYEENRAKRGLRGLIKKFFDKFDIILIVVQGLEKFSFIIVPRWCQFLLGSVLRFLVLRTKLSFVPF